MLAPVKRGALGQRNSLDAADEITAADLRSPAEGLVAVLELSEAVRKLALATGSSDAAEGDLPDKARRYARPLAVVR